MTLQIGERWGGALCVSMLRIPVMPDGYSNLKPDRYSNLMPDTIPI
ncbi:hypothetical protein [Ensifer sp. Root127]|nr:hypothetical protein [Ensifer sp. Root127]